MRNLYLVLLIILMLTTHLLTAIPQMEFSSLEHNFGTLQEEDGVVSHDFEFLNKGDGPFQILKVKAS